MDDDKATVGFDKWASLLSTHTQWDRNHNRWREKFLD